MNESLRQYIIGLVDAPIATNSPDLLTAAILFLPDASLYVSILGGLFDAGAAFHILK